MNDLKEYCFCHINSCSATVENPCFCPCHRTGQEGCWQEGCWCESFGERGKCICGCKLPTKPNKQSFSTTKNPANSSKGWEENKTRGYYKCICKNICETDCGICLDNFLDCKANNSSKGWEEEFDKIFPKGVSKPHPFADTEMACTTEVKAFISTLLQQAVEERINKKSKYLESNSDVRTGILVMKNTRLPIDVVLEHIALGWDIESLKEAFPTFFESLSKLTPKKRSGK